MILDGGIRLNIEVNISEFLNSICNNPEDSVYQESIKNTSAAKFKDIDGFLAAFSKGIQERNPDFQLAQLFSRFENKDKISFNSTNQEVLEMIKSEIQKKLTETITNITKRLEYFGTPAETIKISNFNTIIVDIPGVADQQRICKYLQSTGNLGFWETYDVSEVYPYLDSANRKISELGLLTQEISSDTINENSSLLDQINSEKDNATQEINKEYPLFKILALSVNNEYGFQKGPCVGRASAKDTAKIIRIFNNRQINLCFPRDLRFCWSHYPVAETDFFELIALKSQRNDNALLEGDVVTEASAETDKNSGGVVVSVSMNNEGAKIWERITRENIGKNIAIVIDNQVYTYPSVMSEIKGGKSSITGNFSKDEANDLANILKAGRYNINIRIISSEIIKPGSK
jgi:SecD/SecF fusion protein